MDRIKLQKEFRQMVKDFDGEKAHNNVAGSVCEHYAIEFAIQQVKNCSIPNVSQQRELLNTFITEYNKGATDSDEIIKSISDDIIESIL